MKTGFIGCGNMATAMVRGILKGEKALPEEILVSRRHMEPLQQLQQELGIGITTDNKEVAAFSDVLFLAVKPQFYTETIREIRDVVRENTIVVSIAPGKTLDWLTEQFGRPMKLVRTMPNTPAMVGEGMMGICPAATVTEEELQVVRELCSGFSRTEIVTENLMDVVVSVSGSAPAYVFMFIEAMADAAVADGMPRKSAYTFAAQAVLGSAKMVLETGMHPGELKDMVCSPGGTTIEAVRVLEEKGLRSAVIEAMKACTKKSRDM